MSGLASPVTMLKPCSHLEHLSCLCNNPHKTSLQEGDHPQVTDEGMEVGSIKVILWRYKLLTDSNLGLASNCKPVRKSQQKGYVHITVAKL